jgi:hypothetical protein
MTTEQHTEYAGGSRRSGFNAYQSLAAQTGRPLHEIVTLAEQRRLGELFDDRGELITLRVPSPEKALRQLERLRHPPGTEPLSPAKATGILRAWKTQFDAEIAVREQQRRDDTQRRLALIDALKIPPWEQ